MEIVEIAEDSRRVPSNCKRTFFLKIYDLLPGFIGI